MVQFPLKLAHAVTAHKIQGASVLDPEKVVMDLNSTFEAAQSYVMLSRIQKIDQLFIYENFDTEKIKISPIALRELKRLKSISHNENPSPWKKENNKSIKVAMLNCAGLRSHIVDIKNDKVLLKAHVLQFVETSLEKNSASNDLEIEGYSSHFLNISRGKGQAIYTREDSICFARNVIDNGIQVSKFISSGLLLIAVYRSQNGNIGTLLEILMDMISRNDAVLIVGDFNICNNKKKNNAIRTTLLDKRFKLLVEESTQIMGGFIDHAYWKGDEELWETPCLERYSPYYSDHDALCISLKRK